VCEQLAQGCYLEAERPRFESATFLSRKSNVDFCVGVCESSFLLLQYSVEYLIEYSSSNKVLPRRLTMTFVISNVRFAFWAFFQKLENSGLTPDVKDDPLNR